MIMGAIIWAKNQEPDPQVRPPNTVHFMDGVGHAMAKDWPRRCASVGRSKNVRRRQYELPARIMLGDYRTVSSTIQ